MKLKDYNCNICNARLIKRGWQPRKNEPPVQRWYCKKCKKYFFKMKSYRGPSLWTEEKKKILAEAYKWSKQEELEKRLGITWKNIQDQAARMKLKRMARGNRPTIEVDGDLFNFAINKAGYLLLWNAELGIEGKMAHRYIWEKYNGTIPFECEIHHKDCNRQNNDIKNLALVRKGSNHWQRGSLTKIAKECHQIALSKSWWDFDINGQPTRNIGEALMLITSELGEAIEDYRTGEIDGFTEELADVLIRLFDLSSGLGLDLEDSFWKKMEFNKQRPERHGKAL